MFKIGDKVRGISNNYSITKVGCEGVVMYVNDLDFGLQVTKNSPAYNGSIRQDVFVVKIKDFELIKTRTHRKLPSWF